MCNYKCSPVPSAYLPGRGPSEQRALGVQGKIVPHPPTLDLREVSGGGNEVEDNGPLEAVNHQ